MGKKIAVIGGAGFIGSHTINELTKKGHTPIIVDQNCPPPLNLHWDNKRQRLSTTIDFRCADITNPEQANKALKGVDIVYMLAAISDASIVESDPELGISTNITGLGNVLLSCVKNKVERIIFSSSVWVYSTVPASPDPWVHEESHLSASAPSHIYTSSKIIGENLIRSFKEMYDLDYTILRYGVAYGPGANSGTAISAFTKNALEGNDIVINGDGKSSRSFLYVKDHARGNVLALKESAKNQTINLDGRRKITIKEVAETIQKFSDEEIEIIYKPSVPLEYQGKKVSIQKAKEILGWTPKVSFREGVKKYYEWQSSNYSPSC